MGSTEKRGRFLAALAAGVLVLGLAAGLAGCGTPKQAGPAGNLKESDVRSLSADFGTKAAATAELAAEDSTGTAAAAKELAGLVDLKAVTEAGIAGAVLAAQESTSPAAAEAASSSVEAQKAWKSWAEGKDSVDVAEFLLSTTAVPEGGPDPSEALYLSSVALYPFYSAAEVTTEAVAAAKEADEPAPVAGDVEVLSGNRARITMVDPQTGVTLAMTYVFTQDAAGQWKLAGVSSDGLADAIRGYAEAMVDASLESQDAPDPSAGEDGTAVPTP